MVSPASVYPPQHPLAGLQTNARPQSGFGLPCSRGPLSAPQCVTQGLGASLAQRVCVLRTCAAAEDTPGSSGSVDPPAECGQWRGWDLEPPCWEPGANEGAQPRGLAASSDSFPVKCCLWDPVSSVFRIPGHWDLRLLRSDPDEHTVHVLPRGFLREAAVQQKCSLRWTERGPFHRNPGAFKNLWLLGAVNRASWCTRPGSEGTSASECV